MEYLYGIFVCICMVRGYQGAMPHFFEGLALSDLIWVHQYILFKRNMHFQMSTNMSLLATVCGQYLARPLNWNICICYVHGVFFTKFQSQHIEPFRTAVFGSYVGLLSRDYVYLDVVLDKHEVCPWIVSPKWWIQ